MSDPSSDTDLWDHCHCGDQQKSMDNARLHGTGMNELMENSSNLSCWLQVELCNYQLESSLTGLTRPRLIITFSNRRPLFYRKIGS